MSKKDKIRNHIKKGGSLTSKQASSRGWSQCLSKRISEFKKEGFRFEPRDKKSGAMTYRVDLLKTRKSLLK